MRYTTSQDILRAPALQENQRLLRSFETDDDEEERGLNLNFLKKLIPGTSAYRLPQAAKAKKAQEKLATGGYCGEDDGNRSEL
ncbi:unnamed protein product [Phytophthora lilii]|uniref:Unnamed protein product n=1 Tax=Phytophthora lilii TaxID=2077276 RepID=A0A9W6WXV4_9STRA|nr:unnamed protein product [Phytophthora lilii]